jgi:colanic acid/amylovoran biosynthesis glycosyltransferase
MRCQNFGAATANLIYVYVKMRIFFFARRYPVPYKPYYDTQFADFVRRGHDVRIFAGGTHDEVLNEKVTRYGLPARTTYFPVTLRDLAGHAPRAFSSMLRAPAASLRTANAVYSRGLTPKRGVMDAARALTLPRDKPDLCFIHGLGTAVMFPWLSDVVGDVPIAMYYHGGEVPASNAMEEQAAQRAFDAVDVVFTNTEFSRQHAVERGCPAAKVEILPVGFDLEDFQPASPRTYRPGGILRLMSAGRMSEEKGFIFALQAIKNLVDSGIRDVRYSLTGEGYLRASLEAYVRENHLEPYVHFLGTLSTNGVIEAMRTSDALLLPSIQVGNWVENQACAVQEAMLLQTLVVTSRTGGVPESIPQLMRPFSAEPGSVAELTEAIRRVHALPVEQLVRLGQACRRFVTDNYDASKLNDLVIEQTQAAFALRRGANPVRLERTAV